LRALDSPEVEAVLGPALDGGWWSIGLRAPEPAVFLGVPMSTPGTGAAQRARLRDLGLRTALLPSLRDVDEFDDAVVVGRDAGARRFAETLRAMLPGLQARHAALTAP
jgi:glycosyltransferase A (GT-A) superfamily protein (DUF2064 family)